MNRKAQVANPYNVSMQQAARERREAKEALALQQRRAGEDLQAETAPARRTLAAWREAQLAAIEAAYQQALRQQCPEAFARYDAALQRAQMQYAAELEAIEGRREASREALEQAARRDSRRAQLAERTALPGEELIAIADPVLWQEFGHVERTYWCGREAAPETLQPRTLPPAQTRLVTGEVVEGGAFVEQLRAATAAARA